MKFWLFYLCAWRNISAHQLHLSGNAGRLRNSPHLIMAEKIIGNPMNHRKRITITHFLCWWTHSLWKSLEVAKAPLLKAKAQDCAGKEGTERLLEIVGSQFFGLLVYWADYNAFTWIKKASLKWMWDSSSQKTSALYSCSKTLDSSSYTFQCQSHGIISSKWKTSKTISSIGRDKIQKKKQLRGFAKKTVNLQSGLSKLLS